MDENDFLKMFPGATVIEVIPGRRVECDLCSKDYTNLPDSGGFLFGGYGVCPECAPKFEETIKEGGEEGHIKARCPEGKSFADFIREDCR